MKYLMDCELTDEMYDLRDYNKLLELEAAGHKLTQDEIFELAPRDVYLSDSEKPSKITMFRSSMKHSNK